MSTWRCPCLCLLALVLAAAPARAQNTWPERTRAALRQIRLLPPSAFAQLPPAARADLEKRGCGIPQLTLDTKPHNVIRGSFARAGQTDWAVLCSVADTGSILVYWGGPARCPSLVSRRPNADWLQGEADGSLSFGHAIDAVGRKFILRHYELYGGPRPPRIDHQGIDDASEQASQVHYCHRGRWLSLQGAD